MAQAMQQEKDGEQLLKMAQSAKSEDDWFSFAEAFFQKTARLKTLSRTTRLLICGVFVWPLKQAAFAWPSQLRRLFAEGVGDDREAGWPPFSSSAGRR